MPLCFFYHLSLARVSLHGSGHGCPASNKNCWEKRISTHSMFIRRREPTWPRWFSSARRGGHGEPNRVRRGVPRMLRQGVGGAARRQAFKEELEPQEAAIRGGGAQSSSAQQVAAIRGARAQTSSAHGSRSTSGWSWNKKCESSTHDAKWTGWHDTDWS